MKKLLYVALALVMIMSQSFLFGLAENAGHSEKLADQTVKDFIGSEDESKTICVAIWFNDSKTAAEYAGMSRSKALEHIKAANDENIALIRDIVTSCEADELATIIYAGVTPSQLGQVVALDEVKWVDYVDRSEPVPEAYPGTLDRYVRDALNETAPDDEIAVGVWFELTPEETERYRGYDNEVKKEVVEAVMDRYYDGVKELFSEITFAGKLQPVVEGRATPENVLKLANSPGVYNVVLSDQETIPLSGDTGSASVIDDALLQAMKNAAADDEIAVGVWFELAPEETERYCGYDNEVKKEVVEAVMDRYYDGIKDLFDEITFVGKLQPAVEGSATPENIEKIAAAEGVNYVYWADQPTEPLSEPMDDQVFQILLDVDGKEVDFSGNVFYRLYMDHLDQLPTSEIGSVDYIVTKNYTATDAREILRYSAKLEQLPENAAEAKMFLFMSDVNFDGEVNAADAREALRISAHLADPHEYHWLVGSAS